MTLVDNWKAILTKAWSVRFNVFAILLSAVEALLPLFETEIPRGTFAMLAAIVTAASMTARVIAQKELHDDAP